MAKRKNLWKYVEGVKNWDSIIREFALQVDDEVLRANVSRSNFVSVEDLQFDLLAYIPDKVKEEYKPRLRECWNEAWNGMVAAAVNFATCPKLEDAVEIIIEGRSIGVISEQESEELINKLKIDWQFARDNRDPNWVQQPKEEAKFC